MAQHFCCEFFDDLLQWVVRNSHSVLRAAVLMLLVGAKKAQSLGFCCSFARVPNCPPRGSRTDGGAWSMRLGSQAREPRGLQDHSRTCEGKQTQQLRIESEPTSAARRRRQGLRTVAGSETTELGNLSSSYAAARQTERGQRERPDPELLLRARAPKGDHASLALPAGLLQPPCLLPTRPRRLGPATLDRVGARTRRDERARRGAPSHLGLRFAVR